METKNGDKMSRQRQEYSSNNNNNNSNNKKKMTMSEKNSKLICCKLYISESLNVEALDRIERAGRVDPEAAIVNKFQDRDYNRIRYTLVSYIIHDAITGITYSPMRQVLFSMMEAAYGSINLEMHLGAHPRIGVVDHICFHPLTQASLLDAANLAKLVASDIGNAFQVPVFLYEAAHPNGKALDVIRRELGYYKPNFNGSQWAGWAFPEVLTLEPDEGPSLVNPRRGISVIGASPWVSTYNVPLLSIDVSAARRIARKVSARGGGLPTVQTLGLIHGEDTTEIACMLLDPSRVGADRVHSRVRRLAEEEGLDVENGYFTDYSQEMIIDRYITLLSAD